MAMSASETELIHASLPREPDCGVRGRRLLEEQLGSWLAPEPLGDVKLVATELLNNAFLHGRGQIELRVSRLLDRLRVEVIDEGAGQAIRVNEEPTARGGRGLRIVDAVSLAWGAFEGTTHVWAELAC